MKVIPTTFFACLTASLLSAEPSPPKARVIFPDGDSLSGSPVGVTEEGFLLWRSPLLEQNSPFRTRTLDSIQLSETQPSPEGTTIANITFQTRIDKHFDVLEAELLDFDDQEIRLKTWYAGELTLKRSMLDSIEITTRAPAIFNGPGRLDAWNNIDDIQAWNIRNRSFISSERGSIARKFPELPDQVHFEFDFSFDSSPSLQLYLFADSGSKMTPLNAYSLNIQQNSVRFLKVVDQRRIPLQMKTFGRAALFNNKGLSHVEIFVDRQKGLFSVYLNGTLANSSSDATPLTESHWFHFSVLHNREHTVSNFVIRPWDGVLPKRKDYLDFRQELPTEGEEIELHNGDTIIGKATSIEDGKLKVETEYIPVSVPIERLRSFQITNEEEHEKPRMYSGDVRAHFHTGGHITLRLSEITPTSITGYSQVFGEATFNLHAFTHIDFNPYEPEFRARRGLSF